MMIHGQRRLVGYSPQDHKETDMTQRLNSNRLDLVGREVAQQAGISPSVPGGAALCGAG